MQYDTEACELFLSCMLNDSAGIIQFMNKVDTRDLPLKQWLVWNAMVQCRSDNITPDLDELVFKLTNTAQGMDTALETVGGRDYLIYLKNLMVEKGVYSTKVGLYYERIQQARFRNTIDWLRDSAEEALSKKVLDFDKWWNDAYCHVLEMQQKDQQEAKLLSDYADELIPALDAWLAGLPYMTVTTGFRGFDRILGGGFIKQDLHIIAGSTGSTKTTLALTMSTRQAQQGFRVGWSSLEMSGMMLLLRAMCIDAGVDWSLLRNGGYKDEREYTERELKKSLDKLGKLSLFVDQTAGVTTDNVHWQALQLSMDHKIDIWYVDYAQLLTDVADTPTEKAAKIFDRSKDMAKLLGIPIVVLSQITKRSEYTETKLPSKHDIPHAGHAPAGSIIMTWDVHHYYNTGQFTTTTIPGITDMHNSPIVCNDPKRIYYMIAKNRYGKEGIVQMKYDRQFGRISDLGLAVAPESLDRSAF